MDPDRFLFGSGAKRPTISEWAFAAAKLVAGLVTLFVVVLAPSQHDALAPWLVGWTGMLGVVMVLHFGLFHLLSCGYRRGGTSAVPIMNWPLASQSVAEFWGQRWNLAFRDLAHRWLFRPLVRPLGPAAALWLAFLASGLVHDVVISLPAGGGYGLPTLYFLVQATAILVERSRWGRAAGLDRGLRGRLFCLAMLLTPCRLLFHVPFLENVVNPFLRALGGV
ncbi:MAG: membrane bound O-acyl transferase family-domain-containing protein [Pirellulales bacterium]|nr:membrane bound O-acyl transferase family-domain-containing protein [Pirellulales bacterium]